VVNIMTRRNQPARIRLYTSAWCGHCARARALLEQHGLEYEEIDIGDLDGCCRLHELTGGDSVPQAVVDGRPVGGYDELAALVQTGALAESDSSGQVPTKR
jgi:glutaredoxin 3